MRGRGVDVRLSAFQVRPRNPRGAGALPALPLSPPWRRRPSAPTRPPTKPSPPSTRPRRVRPPPIRKTSAPTNWSCWRNWRSKIGEISAPFGLFNLFFFIFFTLKIKETGRQQDASPKQRGENTPVYYFQGYLFFFLSLKARSGEQRAFLEGGGCLERRNNKATRSGGGF